jgi:hypothetical protein
MSSCVTPGGVRRIRESIDGSLSDVSVQVRPRRRPARIAGHGRRASEFRKAARDASPETRHLETRDGFRALETPGLTLTPLATETQVLNLKSDAELGYRCASPSRDGRPIATCLAVFESTPALTRETTV